MWLKMIIVQHDNKFDISFSFALSKIPLKEIK